MGPVKSNSPSRCFISLLLISGFLVSKSGYSQKPVFRHYSNLDGLPSSEVYCALQDSNGYMWFGTDRGLARFDGYNFKIYTSGNSGLLDNTIFGLYMDHRKRVWYQSYSGYTGYFMEGKFHAYPYNSMIKSALQSGRIDGFNVDEKGGLMFILRENWGYSPLYIDSAGRKAKIENTPYKDIYLTCGNAFLSSGKSNATTGRIISQETGKVLYTFPNQRIKDDIRTFVSRKKNGDIVVYNSSEVLEVNSGGSRKLFSSDGQALSMLIDRNEDIWLGYIGKGVYQYKAAENYLVAHSMLTENSVSGMAQDREGGMWFTTLENGIFYLHPEMILSYDERSGFPKKKVTKVEKVGQDIVCVFSDHEVGAIILGKGEVKMPWQPQGDRLNDLAYVSRDLLVYATEHYPKGFYGKGEVVLRAHQLHIGRYNVWSYITDVINQWDFKGKPARYHDRYIPSRITCVYEMDRNEALIGTLDGLYLYRHGQLSFLGPRHKFFTHRISHIVELDDHTLVIASMGYGLLVTDKTNYGKSFHLTSSEGLPSDMCNMLLRLDDHTLIMGTNKGVCRISNLRDQKSARFRTIDISNGLISNEVNDIELVGNDLWVATGNGISIVPLSNFNEKSEVVFMNIEQVMVNNLPGDAKTAGEFNYNQNNLQFSFTGINYQNSSRLLYKYRLKGSGERWSTSPQRSVIYNGLPPGDYTFEVTVTGLDGLTSIPVKRYSFSISPPFWATWWFYCMSGLAVTGAIYWLVVRRVRAVRRQVQLQHDLGVLQDKALRAQMNPHFVFNSMNAIQNYIQKHDTQASIDYLSLFSRLMRSTFNNSGEKEVTLEKDIEAVSLYANMENMRFANKFKLHISYGHNVHPSGLLVPPLLIQPFVENSIIHGFQAKQDQGNIWLHIETTDRGLEISIRDDGVGRKKTLDILKRSQAFLGAEHISSGIKVTLERIRQVWGEKFSPDMFTITDLHSTTDYQPSGTLVTFFLPIKPV